MKSQNLFNADVFRGGVTGAGFALSADGNGGGNIVVNIPPTSNIRKAYLISGRNGNAPNLTITFSGNSLTFDSTNQVSSTFQSLFGGNSGVHIIDITNLVSSSQSIYSINIPIMQQAGFNRYNEFYLYVLYEDNSMPIVNTYLFLNNQDFGFVNYAVTNIAPIDNVNDVGLSLLTGYIGDTLMDQENIFLNTNFIGSIGGNDINSGFAGGPYGDFYYENNQLFGLSDDTANLQMTKSDVLANISSFLSINTSTFTLDCIPVTLNPINKSNNIWSFFLTYTNNCDTFTTTATALQDTICLGDSVQLNATGGAAYSWYGAFGGLSDTSIANPMATPSQTTTYIVTIKNDSGCVKTEHVKIWVTQPIDSITTTPTVCGNATGSITSHFNTNANYNFTLYDNNFNLLSSNSSGTFNQLVEGVYIVESTLNNCSFYDTVTVNAINNVMANFYSLPQAPWNNPNQALGKAPMEVSFFNASQNANTYLWSITQQPNNDTIVEIPVCTGMTSSCGLQHFFTEGGTYQVCLIAYNNQPQCADTSCKTIFIDNNEEISLFIPNVFTPNGDNENDNFTIQLIGATYLESLEVQVFNRWGQRINNYELEIGNSITNLESPISNLTVWNGTTTAGNKASEGTYFYVITYKTKAGETASEKGTVSLLR